MLYSCKGVVQGNTVLADEKIDSYDGSTVIITILDTVQKKSLNNIDWDSLKLPSERAKNADSYIREIRNNDRI